MGRKTRIILLSVTAVLAVVTFIAMLAVRPGTDSEVLEEARARQQEPLLSVAEPLETDITALTEEEKMAEKVREILLADEEFISAVSASIESVVPEYVSEWVNGEEASLVFSGIQERGVEEAVRRIVTDENIESIAELVASRLGTSDADAYSDATARIVSLISSSLVIPELQKSAIEDAIIEYYESSKDLIAQDVIDRAISEYSSLSSEDRAELLGIDAIAQMLYMDNRDAILADIIGSIPEDEPIDAEKIVSEIYAAHRSAVAEDVISEAVARYSAMSAGERSELLGMGEISAELYEANRSYIIEDISNAVLASVPEAEEIDAEAIAVDLYEKYRDVIAEDVISYFLSEYGIPEPAAETSAPARESISAPVFSSEPAVAPGASQEDYNRAREEMRQRELEKLAAFIN